MGDGESGRPLRIVFDVRHIEDFGFGTYIRNLLLALGKADPVNRYFLTGPRRRAQRLPLAANFEWVDYERPDSDPLDNALFPLFVRGLSPDLTHIPVNLVPALLPRPYVVTVHDLSTLLFLKGEGAAHNWARYRSRRGLLRASRVIAVSQATQRDVQRIVGVPGNRMRQIYSALDPAFLTPTASGEERATERLRVLERYRLPEPFLLFAGRIGPQKNVARLIEAFAVLRGELANHPRYGELRLVIIGDELSKHPETRRAVIHSRVEPYVRFLGFVPVETLRVFYETAAAFVFPSLYEGFGLPPLEAMACGTPVVASNVSSLPEVVGDAAVTVNPDKVFDIARAVQDVLLDGALRSRLIERGRQRAARFRWEDTAAQVLSVYRETVQSRQSKTRAHTT